MLKAIHATEGTLDDLMDEIYAMTDEDLAHCESSQFEEDDAKGMFRWFQGLIRRREPG
jgi:hypothetical protein